MRTVAAEVTNAITLPSDHKQGGRLTVYKSRVYFDALTSDHAPLDARAIGNTGIKLNEASFLLSPESHPEISHKVITAYVTAGNVLSIMSEESSAIISTLSGVDKTCRIGFNANNTTEVYSIYYYSITNSGWEYRNLDEAVLAVGTGSALSDVIGYFAGLPKGSIYPLEGTTDTFVLLDIHEGSVRVGIHDSNMDTSPNQYRFINPIKVMNPATDDIYLLHNAGAALVGNKIFVYYSHYDGSVKSMVCTLQADMRHGVWSDIRVAIPQDLSIFNINNVFAVNGKVFISGSFYRTSQFASTIMYYILAWSDDGLTFTMNRRVLVSLMNLPFQAHTDGVDVMFACTNRIYKTTAPYSVIGESAEHTVTTIVGISGSPGSEITVTLASGSEQYFDSEIIDTGSYAKLELSIETSVGIQFTKYMDCIISMVDKSIKDGGRGNTLSLQSDASWHTSVMTQPWYMEFQGKQSIFDRCMDFSNLYRAASGISPDWSLSVDFWGTGGIPFEIQTHNNTTTRYWTKDLIDYYMEYPMFSTTNNYLVKVYGWSRAGVPATIPNTLDPTAITTLNDSFYPVVEYEDSDGTKHTWVATDANLVTPSLSYPPQVYFQAHEGSYPAVYSMPNPGEGFKITHLGIDVKSRSADNTTYYLERIEMPGISVSMIINGLNDVTFDINNYISDENILTNYMFNKRKGTPQLMFSTKPYSAFNFECTARVDFHGEYSESGLVGLATDSKNFVAGFITASGIKIIKVRDGNTSILEQISTTFVQGTQYDVRLWHRDGVIGFEYKLASSTTWPVRGSIIKHIWATVDDIMSSVDDIFHVGIYSFHNPLHFRITGMKVGETIVAAMPSDVYDVGQFPSSGQVDIDGMIYSYTGATSHFTETPALGPFRALAISAQNYPFNQDIDGSFMYQGGGAIDFTASNPLPGSAHSTDFEGAIIAATNGKAWMVQQMQWKTWSAISGVPVLQTDQARVYSDGISPDSLATGTRVYITDGLTGLVAVDKVKETAGVQEANDMNTFMHCPGVFAYYNSGDEMRVYGFRATSGDHDQTIHKLIDLFHRLAGTEARFLGDWNSSQILTDGEDINLYD